MGNTVTDTQRIGFIVYSVLESRFRNDQDQPIHLSPHPRRYDTRTVGIIVVWRSWSKCRYIDWSNLLSSADEWWCYQVCYTAASLNTLMVDCSPLTVRQTDCKLPIDMCQDTGRRGAMSYEISARYIGMESKRLRMQQDLRRKCGMQCLATGFTLKGKTPGPMFAIIQYP